MPKTQQMPMQKRRRIVLTGGPGGGKTTAADLLRRELGSRVVVVPEAATILFAGGFPRSQTMGRQSCCADGDFSRAAQPEDVQSALYGERVLLCDRGTIDGAAYWNDGADSFFASLGTTFDAEVARYDAVVFFETAAVAGLSIEGGNPVRCESLSQAVELDARLRALWSRHPRFTLIPHSNSFMEKIVGALAVLERLVDGDSAR